MKKKTLLAVTKSPRSDRHDHPADEGTPKSDGKASTNRRGGNHTGTADEQDTRVATVAGKLRGIHRNVLTKPATAMKAAALSHVSRPTCVAIATGGIVTCDEDGNVELWDTTTGAHLRDVGKHNKKAAFVTAWDKYAFVASYDGTVKIWDTTTASGTKPHIDFKKHAPNSEVWAVAVDSGGTRVVSGTNHGEILMWDVDLNAGTTQPPVMFDAGDDEAVAALAFRPGTNDSEFFSGHGAGLVRRWSVTTGPKDPPLSHNNSHTVNSIAFTSNGLTAVSCSLDLTLRIWNLGGGTSKLLRHDDMVWRVAISGTKLASASQDGTVRVWRLPDGDPLDTFLIDRGSMGVAFVSDTRIVYTGNGTGDAVIFQDV